MKLSYERRRERRGRRLRASAALGALCCLATLISPEPALAGDGPALLWSFSSGTEGWIPRAVSIGNEGTQAFTQIGPFTDRTRLYSVHDSNPPAAVWTRTDTSWTYDHQLASADTLPIHVSLHKAYVSGTSGPKRPVVRKYTSSSSTPGWQYTFTTDHFGSEPASVAISRDGQRIVAASLDTSAGFKVRVAVFGPNSGTPITTTLVDTGGSYGKMLLSADGSTLYFWAGTRLTVFDVPSAQVLWSATIFSGPIRTGHGLSGDGRTFAFGAAEEVRIYRRNSQGTYAQVHAHALPAGFRADQLAISDDGSTLVCGAGSLDNRTVRILALELVAFAPTMTYQATSSGTLANLVSDIAVGGDGRNFVAGLWGEESGTIPELLFFDTRSNQPIGSHDLPGSVLELDLAADGSRVVVASKAVHATTFAGGGHISLLDARAVDFEARGIPRAGGQVEFSLHARLPHPAVGYLVVSRSPASPPQTFPGAGTLYLDRSDLSLYPMGTIVNGTVRERFDLDANAPVGSSLYVQGLSSHPRLFTQDWVKLTILP